MRSIERGAPSYAGRVRELFMVDRNLEIWFERASTEYRREHLREAVGRVREEMRSRELCYSRTGLNAIAQALFYLAGWPDWEEEVERFEEERRERVVAMGRIKAQAQANGSDWKPTQEVLQMDVERPDTTYREGQ